MFYHFYRPFFQKILALLLFICLAAGFCLFIYVLVMLDKFRDDESIKTLFLFILMLNFSSLVTIPYVGLVLNHDSSGLLWGTVTLSYNSFTAWSATSNAISKFYL